MSQRIANLLDQPASEVTKLLAKLEGKNGYPSHDVRYLANSIQQVRQKIIELGLDPDDTTGEELYQAILTKYQKDSHLFDEQLHIDGLNYDHRASIATQLVAKQIELPRQWTLKKAAAKNILRQLPPKRTMKYLNYRSTESILKREDVNEIYLAASCLESASWLKAHSRLISKLNQMDFELRPIKLLNLNYAKWQAVQPVDYVVLNDEVGAMSLWPGAELEHSPLLTMVIQLFDKIAEFQEISLGLSVAKTGGLALWWVDMDHLIAELSEEHVSLSLKDCATNLLDGRDYSQRTLDHARTCFWKALINQYDKLPEFDGIFDNSVKQKISKLKFAIPEPAYEYVEDYQ